MTTYQLTGEGYVVRDDGAKVPITTTPEFPNTNPDYFEYLQWIADGNTPMPAPVEPIEDRQAAAWERIKEFRDRRKAGGVLVGAYWFHSDDSSRIQQLGLLMMGANMPGGIMWKTMGNGFVEMTPTLAGQIFSAAAASDQALFTIAEQHKAAMMAAQDPDLYDFTTGWPATFEGVA